MRFSSTASIALLAVALSAFAAGAQDRHSDLATAGWNAILNDQGAEALRLFESALSIRPDDAVLLLGSGAALHRLGRESDAIRALARALELNPTLAVASRLLAEIAIKEGDLALGIATYERALVQAPDNVEMASRLDQLNDEVARRGAAARLTVAFAGERHQALGEHASRVLNGTYWQVAKLVGAYPAGAITVELNTSRPFRAGESGSTATPASNQGRISINAEGALEDVDAFNHALTLELVRAMVIEMAPTGVPVWFADGLAQIVASADAAVARRRLRETAEIPWTRFETVGSRWQADAQLRADASLLIVHTLLARIGSRSTQFLDDLAEGLSLDEALAPFGFSYADLKTDVARSLEP